ncbi:single-stranded DNA-binding protein [Candidatus Roizmanbacteria bacterium]|nr:single-stranded DNA-binding protein [Candidatus Roizmanbacteria bacterium]
MASRSLNKVILVGNLTRDPELKYTPSGAPVCTFGLATNRSWTTQDGQIKEEVQYHRITAWHKLAELCSKLLAKGRKVYLEGRIAYRSFTGKDGQQRSITEIILDDFIVFGDGKRPVTLEEGKEEVQAAPKEVSEVEEKEAPSLGDEDKTSAKKRRGKTEEKINPDDIPF